MSNYQNGKIYKIVCNITNEIYVGSTISSLSERLRHHISEYKYYINNKQNFVSSFVIIERGNYKIVLLENCPCETKEQLLIRERYYFDTLNCINKMRPIITTKEQCEYKQDYYKQYYIENRDEIKEQHKQYYIENKKEIAKKHKQYGIENREKLTELFDCECGGKYQKQNKALHFKSKRHQNYLQQLSIN
jgi:hypothetical protein